MVHYVVLGKTFQNKKKKKTFTDFYIWMNNTISFSFTVSKFWGPELWKYIKWLFLEFVLLRN